MNLNQTILTNANLSGARVDHSTSFFGTVLVNVNMDGAVDLAKADHQGPSYIDFLTLAKSISLPEEFLRGVGLQDWEIEIAKLYQKNLSPQQVNDIVYKIYDTHTSNPIQFYSTFISYSRADRDFAHQLYHTLQNRGIRCWLDEHQILPGDDIRDQIDQGINLWDKVILCCSESSLNSYWVNVEIDKALKKEERLWKKYGERLLALIPLNLDNYLFKWTNSRASSLTDRHAEDLVEWKEDEDKLKRAFDRIERALRADSRGRERPPVSLF